jgi:hypothetical protein
VCSSRTQKVDDQSDAAIIRKSVKESKERKEAEALLEEEMQKPTAARNKALLRKYGLENTTGLLINTLIFQLGISIRLMFTSLKTPIFHSNYALRSGLLLLLFPITVMSTISFSHLQG